MSNDLIKEIDVVELEQRIEFSCCGGGGGDDGDGNQHCTIVETAECDER